MKILILLSFLIATSALGQSTNNPPVSTNNVPVVLRANEDALLRATWRADNNLRTNAIAPYTNSLPEQSFKDYMTGIVSEALVMRVAQIQGERRNKMEAMFMNASEAKQRAALNALK